MAYVYKHTRLDTNVVFYIGIGNIKNYKRAYSKLGRNYHWENIVKKTKFTVEIINDNLDWDDACKMEQYWIRYYGRRDLNEGTLVNMTDGGGGAPNVADEVKKSISIKAKIRLKVKENNGMYGKNHTDESKAKMSKLRKGIGLGRKMPDGFGKRMSELFKGKHVSEQTKLNQSIANKNRTILTCPHCGVSSTHNMNRYHFSNCKKVNPDLIRVSRGCWLGKVRVTDLLGNNVVYESASQVSKEMSLDLHSVLKHSKAGTEFKYGKCKGWRFELINEGENNGSQNTI